MITQHTEASPRVETLGYVRYVPLGRLFFLSRRDSRLEPRDLLRGVKREAQGMTKQFEDKDGDRNIAQEDG
ncbi:hypothetical protein [Candidatus Electrothrix sp.]|uniref:hypothetical protein n=1 Tax=Candidatus Electrothrix sp. TaxID=2170559 RepID=UPI004057973F